MLPVQKAEREFAYKMILTKKPVIPTVNEASLCSNRIFAALFILPIHSYGRSYTVQRITFCFE